MKRIGLYILLAALCIACNTAKNNLNESNDIPDFVVDALQNKNITVVVNQMQPQRYYSRDIYSYHYIKINQETLISDLPYLGQVQTPSAYSSITKGLNFTEVIRQYEQVHNPRKKRAEINIIVKNDEDSYLYRIFIYYNGNAEIMVKPTKRDYIRFYGQLIQD